MDKGGRPNHHITKGTRKLVRSLAYADLTQEQIAEELEISVPTLVKYYKADIDSGKARVVGQLMHKSLKNALKGNSVSSARERMFHLERKGGMTRTETLDLNHKGEVRTLGHFYGEGWDNDKKSKKDKKS